MIGIGDRVPGIRLDAYHQDEIRSLSLTDFRGRWLAIVFYPGDFTFICPTELRELARLQPKFAALGSDLVSVSTDSVWVHKAWHDQSKAIGGVDFPMLADPAGRLAREFGTLIEDEGVARRGSFVVDPDGVVQALEIHDNSVGRDMCELLRRVEAARHVRENQGEVCPVSWRPGLPTLRPGLRLVGAI